MLCPLENEPTKKAFWTNVKPKAYYQNFTVCRGNQEDDLAELCAFFLSALAGMSLAFASETLGASQYGIRMASETENHMTSVERVFTYTEIDPEPGYNNETLPPEDWPTVGTLTLHDLSLAYLKGAPATLNSINVSVDAKAKVGVVGRTGAGKSSLAAALFRMPEPKGKVIFYLIVI